MATWVVYAQFKLAMCVNANNANLKAGGDTIQVMLANAGYTPNANADQFVSTPRTYEVANGNGGAGTYFTGAANNLGYSANMTCTLYAANTVSWGTSNANQINWAVDSANGFSALYVILYKKGGSDAASPLIAFANLGSNQTNSSGSLTLQVDSANGVFTLA